ncbi:MAG: hypothetical protein FWD05_09650 [Oscillospiraceae bacterium]|nr:hypothetical protein [Oscillospiraceae bacterium]
MGTWDSSLYGNDKTCDVKDAYMRHLTNQLSNQEAYDKTMELFKGSIGDEHEEPLFWFALAETQWKVGRLTSDVREKAMEWIEKDGGVALWEDSGVSSAGWKKTLAKLKEKLESPMRSEKKIRKPAEFDANPWALNDVYAYQFNKKSSEKDDVFGKYMIMQKIGEKDSWVPGGKFIPTMRVQFYDKLFEELPTLDDLKKLRLLPLDLPYRHNISRDYLNHKGIILMKKDPVQMNAVISMHKKSDYPTKFLTFLGNTQGLPNVRKGEHDCAWLTIDSSLYTYYLEWQGKEYDTVGEGEYDYLGNM